MNYNPETLVVNLFAGPGAGKTTAATDIFSELKWSGVNAEYVPEWIKNMVWENREKVFQNQLYVFGKQHYNISRLLGEVDVVVTDSPLLFSSFYNKLLSNTFDKFVFEEFSRFTNMNYFVNRVKPYNPKGRLETEDKAKDNDIKIKEMLDKNNIIYIDIEGSKKGVTMVVNDVLYYLTKKGKL